MLTELLGLFKDKVPCFDIRRLYNLRSYLLRIGKLNPNGTKSSGIYPPLPGNESDNHSVSLQEEDGAVLNKVIQILGNEAGGVPR